MFGICQFDWWQDKCFLKDFCGFWIVVVWYGIVDIVLMVDRGEIIKQFIFMKVRVYQVYVVEVSFVDMGIVENVDIVVFQIVILGGFIDYGFYCECYDINKNWQFVFVLDECVFSYCMVQVMIGVVGFCDDGIECIVEQGCIYFVGDLFYLVCQNCQGYWVNFGSYLVKFFLYFLSDVRL